MAYSPQKYLNWLDNEAREGLKRGEVGLRNFPIYAADGMTPEDTMLAWESHGEQLPSTCQNPPLLYAYLRGKWNRDLQISQWKQGVKDGLSIPEEFLGCLGMDIEEFRGVFGRYPDLLAWRAQLRMEWRLEAKYNSLRHRFGLWLQMRFIRFSFNFRQMWRNLIRTA